MSSSILLSVLIPIYNWDITALLAKLVSELRRLTNANIEIIIIDDCSNDVNVKCINQKAITEYQKSYSSIIYLELPKNVGRAAIRNLLAQQSQGAFLLFLDSDVVPDAPNFISKYIQNCGNYDVVCGGISYQFKTLYNPKYRFYLYFSSKTDVKASTVRNLNPWKHVLTSNILIRREVFINTSFDKRFTGYGYEDIEWGIRLYKKGYRIFHIDNTVSHLGLVTKTDLLSRMVISIKNYGLLAEMHPDFFKYSSIYHYSNKLQRLPIYVLKMGAFLAKLLFRFSFDNFSSFLFFQFYKAVLLSLYFKQQKEV
jgi:glycosyltransferase involved in cell wall biosynthesis